MKTSMLTFLILAGCYSLRAQTTPSPELLLKIEYGGYYSTVIPGQYLGDTSAYWETRFIIHKDIPSATNYWGGISFNPGANAFVAVNDGFMAGLSDFTMKFFFYVAYSNPTSGTLVGSNWPTPNDGDWLLQFTPDGRLTLMMQYGGQTHTASSVSTAFFNNTRHDVRLEKVGVTINVYVNNALEITMPCPANWLENGVPLAFGGNAYDRLGGMDYFTGTIGDIEVWKP